MCNEGGNKTNFMLMPSAPLDSPESATGVLALDRWSAFRLHINFDGTLKTIMDVAVPFISVVVAVG